MTYQLIHANANNLPLQDSSVDLIITSPPYFALRSYRDDGEHYDGQIGSEETPTQFLDALIACTAEMKRVLKPTGSIFVNLGDKYAGTGGANDNTGLGLEPSTNPDVDRFNSNRNNTKQTTGYVPRKSLMGLPWRYALKCIDELNLILRQEIIWHKPNGLPESVTDRTRRNHEQWFHFVKEPKYYTAIDTIREEYAPASLERFEQGDPLASSSRQAARLADGGNTPYDGPNPLGRLPGSVWTIPTEPLTGIPEHLPQHYAAFPQEWPRRLILGWSPTGICDECGEGRRPVVNVEYEQYAERRTNARVSGLEQTGDSGRARPGSADAPHGDAHAHRTITGEQCDCPTPSAPTTPAIVLDPFAGTGTVPGVAHTLGRHGIGTDLSHDYLKLAKWRITESGHFEKSYQRSAKEGANLPLTPPPTPTKGQESLL